MFGFMYIIGMCVYVCVVCMRVCVCGVYARARVCSVCVCVVCMCVCVVCCDGDVTYPGNTAHVFKGTTTLIILCGTFKAI